jgi:hypothetical protein
MPPVRLEAKIWASLNDDSGANCIAGTVKLARETTSLFDIVDRRAIRAVAAHTVLTDWVACCGPCPPMTRWST